uniref:Uncharacterized protein n=1 Tax=Schistosoma curassoni TaxID=6186 RepID=A0A183KLG4_9TREM
MKTLPFDLNVIRLGCNTRKVGLVALIVSCLVTVNFPSITLRFTWPVGSPICLKLIRPLVNSEYLKRRLTVISRFMKYPKLGYIISFLWKFLFSSQ